MSNTERDALRKKTIDYLAKEVGPGIVCKYSDRPPIEIDVIPSGSLSLDAALGVGGYAKGRVIELFGYEASGKTMLTLMAIANCQKAGGTCAFIDAEHALDPAFAELNGVNMEELYLSQPDYGEQALDIAVALATSGTFDLVVIDSVAALTPKAEIEGDMEANHIGRQARMMSQGLRKLTAVTSRTNTTVMFINQIRQKIGVMFGCFSYDSRVTLADGSTEKIGKIVNNKLPVEVLSFDPVTGICEPKRVVAWHDNGNADYFLSIQTEGVKGNGKSSFGVTPNHMLFTPGPDFTWVEKQAGDFKVGDMLGHKAPFVFSQAQYELALGSILGDGSLRKKGTLTQLRFGHGPDQTDYCKWKESVFSNLVSWVGTNSTGGWSFDCVTSADLNIIHAESYSGKNRVLSKTLLKHLTPFGVAVWAMDDGTLSGSYDKWGNGKFSISAKSYSEPELEMLANKLNILGFGLPSVSKRKQLVWTGEQAKTFFECVTPYIHPSMSYKIPPKFWTKEAASQRALIYQKLLDNLTVEPIQQLIPVTITKISTKTKTRSMKKFDLTVEGHHTYLVDGLAVHNSPDTTTGGNALKFYASQRLEVSKTSPIKGADEDPIGHTCRVKIVKNKVAPPFKKAEFKVMYGTGIDSLGETLDMAVAFGLVDKSGAWYSFNGERLGQGAENAKAGLQAHPEWLASIEKDLREHLIKK